MYNKSPKKLSKPSLFTIEELIIKLNCLNKESMPNWGVMNSSQMMKHCSAFIDLYLGKIKLTFWYKIFGVSLGKLFLLYIVNKSLLETPKNLKTDGSIKVSDVSLDFSNEKEILIQKLNNLYKVEGHIINPIYGRMESGQIKFLITHHTIHHFNQFGLI